MITWVVIRLTNVKLALQAINPEAALRSTTHAKSPSPNEKGMLPSAKAPLGLRHKDLNPTRIWVMESTAFVLSSWRMGTKRNIYGWRRL